MAVKKVVYGSRTLIDLTQDNVTSDKMLKGTFAHDASGQIIEGSIEIATDAEVSAYFANIIEIAGDTEVNTYFGIG